MKRIAAMLSAAIVCITTYAQPDYPAAGPIPNLAKAEYFFDTDPGFGNGTPISLNAVTDINALPQTFTLSGSALSNGIHRLYLRTQDQAGRWSFAASTVFDNYIVSVYPVATAQPAITALEYFIDTDPGTGNGIATPVATQVAVNITGLTPGTHRVYVRAKDANDRWSFVAYSLFDNTTIVPYPSAPPTPAPVSELEYFIDNDPGFGNGTAITSFQFDVGISALTEGLHTLYVRAKGNPYSMTAYSEFLKGVPLPLTWLFVKGEVAADEHVITWGTANEVNVSHFEIEHSTDGVHYKVVGKVSGAYRFAHKSPGGGWNFYRVVEHDHDGFTSRSKVITLLNTSRLNKTLVGPNPFTDRLQIVTGQQENARRIIVYSTTSRMVMEQPVTSQFTALNMGSLPAGVYFVKIIYANKEATYKVIRK